MNPTLRPGDLVAQKYRLRAPLGQGGMGTVWSAEHALTGRQFAIKVLHSSVSSAEDTRHRFLQEARASARIDHPNVIDVLDFGQTDDGGLFLVMELLDGLSLSEVLRCEPPLSARELLAIVAQAATGLAAAHAVGVVHRDVKPANVFLHRDRSVGSVVTKVVDFGVSKLAMGDDGVTTSAGSLLGSPRYMSPEQAISATSADARSDLWSLGVLLFEALSGVFPHDGDSSNNLVVAIATRPPRSIHQVAPQLPVALRDLVHLCLRPQRERLASAVELVERCLDLLARLDLSDVSLRRSVAHRGAAIPRPSDLFIDTGPTAAELMRRRLASVSEVRGAALGEQLQAAARGLQPADEASAIELRSIDVASLSELGRPTVELEEATRMLALPSAPGLATHPATPPVSLAPAAPLLHHAAPPPFAPPPYVTAPQGPTQADPGESVSSIHVVRTGRPPPGPHGPFAVQPRRRWPLAVGLGLLAGLAAVTVGAVIVVATGPEGRGAAPKAAATATPADDAPRFPVTAEPRVAPPPATALPAAPSDVARIDDAEVEAELAREAERARAAASASSSPSAASTPSAPPAPSAAATAPASPVGGPVTTSTTGASRPPAPTTTATAKPTPKPKPKLDDFGSGL